MQKANQSRGLRFLSKVIITVGLISAAIAYQAPAQNVYTQPVGFYTANATNSSDTYLCTPFEQIPQFSGTVLSTAVSGTTGIIAVAGSPSWSVNQWATPTTPNGYLPYYVTISSNGGGGTYAGAYYTILSNDVSGKLYVGFASAGAASDNDLAGIAVGDYVNIVPFWQLNTVWSNGVGVVASTGTSTGTRRTQINFPNLTASGINLSFSTAYYFYNNHWRKAGGAASATFDDVVMLPDQYVIQRNATNATDVTATTFLGQVVTSPIRIGLFASNSGSVDNELAIYRPAVETLLQSGLTNPAFKASTGTSSGTRQDQVLVFNNAQQAQNKSFSQAYYFYNNGWRLAGGAATVDFSQSNVFNIASGIIVRKQTNSTSFATWVNPPPY